VELRHLRYFVEVGEEEHFGRAAQRLRVAQPALSRQIQDLEREIGFKLFDRLSRGVKISSAQEPPAARHDGRTFYLVSEARERGVLRPLDIRVFPWRPEIASDHSRGVKRSDDTDTRRSRA
jgi:Bacterial regulatory helix-turn-helix protein, lysR family